MKPRYYKFIEREPNPKVRAAGLFVCLLWCALALRLCVPSVSASDIPWCVQEVEAPVDERAAVLLEEPTLRERMIISATQSECRHYNRSTDPYDLLFLSRMESILGVNQWRPGLLLGVFCIESGLRTTATNGGLILGDYKDGVARAWGPFQLWPTHRRDCGETGKSAHDLAWAARCWVTRVNRVMPKAAKRCSENTWMVAEAAVSNSVKYRWNCYAASAHWSIATNIWRKYDEAVREAQRFTHGMGESLFQAANSN